MNITTDNPGVQNAADGAFRDRAVACLRNAQSAWLDLLADSGLRDARPIHVGRRLGMTRSMAWKIWKFTRTSDLSQASHHLPGPGGVEIMLKAAKSSGVQVGCIDAVRSASQTLQEFIDEYAGSRRTFEAMLAGESRDEQHDYKDRRAMYRASSIIWGVRARVQMGTMLMRPSESDPRKIDIVTLTGLLDFERLRADVPWIIRRSLNVDSDNKQSNRRPLVPSTSTATDHSLSLIPEYCSKPLPGLREFAGPDEMVYTEIVSNPVGRAGATTIVMGELFARGCDFDLNDGKLLANMELHTPVTCAVNDLFLHEDLVQFRPPDVEVFNRAENRPRDRALDRLQVPLYSATPATNLGIHQIGLPSSGVPNTRIDQYREIIASAIKLADWDHNDRFRGFRAELEYPPVPCRLTLHSAG